MKTHFSLVLVLIKVETCFQIACNVLRTSIDILPFLPLLLLHWDGTESVSSLREEEHEGDRL